MFTCDPFSIYCMDLLGGWREEVEEVKASALPAGGERSAATAWHPGLCCPFSSPLPHLLGDSNYFFLVPIACELSGSGIIFHCLCIAKWTNSRPLGSCSHCYKDYDIINNSFVSYWQGSPGRRGPQGEQGEPGPKVSPGAQHHHWPPLLQGASEAGCAAGCSRSWCELDSLGWDLPHCSTET